MKLARLLALGSVALMVCGISLADATAPAPANPSSPPSTSDAGSLNSTDVSPK